MENRQSPLDADGGRGYEQILLGSVLMYGAPILDMLSEIAVEVPVLRNQTAELHHKHIWSAICELADEGAPVDQVSVHDRLSLAGRGNGTALMELMHHASVPEGLDYYIRNWIAFRVKDEARIALEKLRATTENGTTTEALRAGLAEAMIGLDRYRIPDPDDDDAAPRMVWMSEVAEVEVEWFWEPYIPIGFLSGLEGDPGQGKSFVSHALATAASLGRGLPGCTGQIKPQKSLLLTAEDDLGATVTKRLKEMDADRSLIAAISKPWPITDGEGRALLETYILASGACLVVIDPIVNYLDAKMNANQANEVRGVLRPLAALARKHRCAIVIIRHLSKAQATKAIYRGQGSIDFTAACRSVMLAGCMEKDSENRAVVQIKSNLAPMGRPVGYSLEEGVFRWTGESEATAGDILNGDGDEKGGASLRAAKLFLREELGDGPVDSKVIEDEGKAQGISKSTLWRAKEALRVGVNRRSQEGAGRGHGKWEWWLPKIS